MHTASYSRSSRVSTTHRRPFVSRGARSNLNLYGHPTLPERDEECVDQRVIAHAPTPYRFGGPAGCARSYCTGHDTAAPSVCAASSGQCG